MLHNMLLGWDGLNGFNWKNLDPDGDLDNDIGPELVLRSEDEPYLPFESEIYSL